MNSFMTLICNEHTYLPNHMLHMNKRENDRQRSEVQRHPGGHWDRRAWVQGFAKNVLRYWVQGPLP